MNESKTAPIDFYRHQLGDEELASVAETLRSLFLTTGPKTRALEQALAARLGVPHVVGVSSNTMGLFLALRALDIGPGDEVITTPLTFIATGNVIIHAGATPVFVDVEETTGNIDLNAVERAITAKTKAIMPVHLYGLMVDMPQLAKLADQHGLRIVEDAAHALEAERSGARPGTAGDAAVFSFYATKNITCGDGGAVTARSDELAARLRRLRNHGMSKDAFGRYHGSYQHWDMVELGYKANLPDVLSSLLLPQLSKIDEKRTKRSQLAAQYDSSLVSLVEQGKVRLPSRPSNAVHAHHLYTIWVDPKRRDDVLSSLKAQDVGVAVNYRAIHLLSYYQKTFGHRRGAFPAAERIGDSTLSLPFYPTMDPADIDRVAEALELALSE